MYAMYIAYNVLYLNFFSPKKCILSPKQTFWKTTRYVTSDDFKMFLSTTINVKFKKRRLDLPKCHSTIKYQRTDVESEHSRKGIFQYLKAQHFPERRLQFLRCPVKYKETNSIIISKQYIIKHTG